MLVSAWPTIRASHDPDRLADRLLQLHLGLGVDEALGEHRLAQHLGGSAGAKLRGRHPGEGRELVDHPADVADLADDRLGATVEGVQVAGDVLAVLAAHPFGRQLDRGQRVLDLVGDAAGDVLPGGVALGGEQAGDVVEGQHQTLGRVAGARKRRRRVSAPRTTSISSSASLPVATARSPGPRPAARGRRRPAAGQRPPFRASRSRRGR
jgi:hypothetical protein